MERRICGKIDINLKILFFQYSINTKSDLPIFMGYGADDPIVPAKLAERAAPYLIKTVSRNIHDVMYRCLGHALSDEVGIYLFHLIL